MEFLKFWSDGDSHSLLSGKCWDSPLSGKRGGYRTLLCRVTLQIQDPPLPDTGLSFVGETSGIQDSPLPGKHQNLTFAGGDTKPHFHWGNTLGKTLSDSVIRCSGDPGNLNFAGGDTNTLITLSESVIRWFGRSKSPYLPSCQPPSSFPVLCFFDIIFHQIRNLMHGECFGTSFLRKVFIPHFSWLEFSFSFSYWGHYLYSNNYFVILCS